MWTDLRKWSVWSKDITHHWLITTSLVVSFLVSKTLSNIMSNVTNPLLYLKLFGLPRDKNSVLQLTRDSQLSLLPRKKTRNQR
jgi:hypothetical protein